MLLTVVALLLLHVPKHPKVTNGNAVLVDLCLGIFLG